MKAEHYRERRLEVAGWPLRLTSYKIGDLFHCHADNVSPGANVARASAPTQEEAERRALEKAQERLASTRRR